MPRVLGFSVSISNDRIRGSAKVARPLALLSECQAPSAIVVGRKTEGRKTVGLALSLAIYTPSCVDRKPCLSLACRLPAVSRLALETCACQPL